MQLYYKLLDDHITYILHVHWSQLKLQSAMLQSDHGMYNLREG